MEQLQSSWFSNHSRHVGNVLRNYDEDFPAHRVCSACGIISAEGCIPKIYRRKVSQRRSRTLERK